MDTGKFRYVEIPQIFKLSNTLSNIKKNHKNILCFLVGLLEIKILKIDLNIYVCLHELRKKLRNYFSLI